MKKKSWTDRIGDFIAGKGFYIVLFLCVAAIGISGYYLFSTLNTGTEDVAVGADVQVVVTPAPTPAPSATPSVKPTVSPSPTPKATATPKPSATPTPTPSATPAPASTPKATVFTWPVKGEIVSDFSLEVLAYDETMGDWRTHCGIDIAAGVGTEVLAVGAGTVERVYQDDLMGATVVIHHGDELRSIYCNLAATPTVSEGDTVSAGDILGAVGETALAERDRPAHLHLEMSKNGLETDPVSYLPELP